MSEPNLTLFNIAAGMRELWAALEDCERRISECPDGQFDLGVALNEEHRTIREELQKYMQAEVRKADGVAAYIREKEAFAAAAKAESKRLADRAKALQTHADRVRDMALWVMQGFDLERIDGAQSNLVRAKNRPSVHISDESLLPQEFWREKPVEREPDKVAIAKALKPKPCFTCNGTGENSGLLPGDNCGVCGGTGKIAGVVPGARLEESERLEVR